jgi:hypothetical protein
MSKVLDHIRKSLAADEESEPRALEPILPQVLLPTKGRNEKAYCLDVKEIIGPLNVAFMRQGRLEEVVNEPPGKLDRHKLARGGWKFRPLTGIRIKSWIEQFLSTGSMKRVGDKWVFKEQTMTKELGSSMIESPFFQEGMPRILRILPVPIPIQTPEGDFCLPQPGYNPELEIFCAPDAPVITPMDLDQAKKILEQAHQGFEFRNPQSRTHAYARFLTPYFRGLIGFSESVPCWFFNANRPRAGKDYLAGITQIVYGGFAFEDCAISNKDADETRKRITAGLLAGRSSFHFANCQGNLEDPYFIQAITCPVWRDRLMGSNSAQSDLSIPNEAEYSISANAGLTYREDLEPRLRLIELAFYEEDANARVFPNEDLHEWVSANRALLLSAAHSIFEHWWKKGCPEAYPFSSFKRWGKCVGGAMVAAGLGNPTLPYEEEPLIEGDRRTTAMKAVFELGYQEKSDEWIAKKELIALVAEHQAKDERFEWFGDLNDDKTKRSAALKLGQALRLFEGRWLSGIRLLIDHESQQNVARQELQFTKNRAARLSRPRA